MTGLTFAMHETATGNFYAKYFFEFHLDHIASLGISNFRMCIIIFGEIDFEVVKKFHEVNLPFLFLFTLIVISTFWNLIFVLSLLKVII